MLGKKRGSEEDGERSELGRKRVKTQDLESVFCSEGRAGRETLQEPIGPTHGQLDLNAKACIAEDFYGDDANRLPSPGKHEIECNVDRVISREFGLDLNPEDVSSHDPFYPCKNYDLFKSRDDSECGSSSGPLEERDAMRIWKEMKQNGFLSSSQVGVRMPKPRGRKSKTDRLKKRMELAKQEQVDRFAKIAAPSGLLNGLNPGIINHVRNSKQVHSIIEALVRSEKRENRHAGSKQSIQTKSGKEEFCDRKKDLENLNGLGMNRITLCPEDGSNILLGSKKIGGCPISMKNLVTLNSGITREGGDSSMVERRVLGKNTCPSHSNPDSEDDILALKLSSSSNIFSKNPSSLSNENFAGLTNVTSLSVEAANVASQWLELLHQDIKGRLTALRRSRKRVGAVIHTDLPNLMSREFSSNQENNPYVTKKSATEFSESPTAKAHQNRWSALFDQMDKALSEEEKQLESWLNGVKEMQLHCEQGIFQYNTAYDLQQLGALKSNCRLYKPDISERDLAVRAAAASIYSTCNFLLSSENSPCFSSF